ncbi:hypothetical protein CWS72_14945 [Telmatospirillum siberiense]|uniref:Uncharacterized protein n=2 Tax=Telmatospirillum siberiense TaxID=382514 RepID=A0A2N3PTR2_9PROT|nr:hypothetical protein CWS72_14945 [Telmatospirillum siberiense]
MLNLASNALFDKTGEPDVLQAELAAFLAGTPGTDPSDQGPFYKFMNTPSPNYPCLTLPPENASQGDWGTVWGPVVFQAKNNQGATNTMFVAQSPSLKIYVVAIAGTNPAGWTGATLEDLDVAPADMKAWPPTANLTPTPNQLVWNGFSSAPSPSTPAIDAGTADGISNLYTMQDPNSGQTLVQFLNSKSVTQTGQTLVFTGHSLGGALAPTLAMLLYPQAAQSPTPSDKNAPNPEASGWANVYILASAGPTPGTPGFAGLFFTPPASQQVGPYTPAPTSAQPCDYCDWTFGYWNMNYANTYDVVPRAWWGLAGLIEQPTGSDVNYPSFFAGGAELAPKMGKLDLDPAGPDAYALMNDMMSKSGYDGGSTAYYTPCLMQSPFYGKWGSWGTDATQYPPAWTPATPPTLITYFADLIPWVLNAHLGQYSYALLGYPSPTIDETSAT